MFATLKKQTKQVSAKTLSQAMRYYSVKNFQKRIEKFWACKSLEEWLNKGGFDFNYDSLGFYTALCKAMGINQERIDTQIKKTLAFQQEKQRFADARVLIVTNFSIDKNTTSLVVLSMAEGIRRVSLANSPIFWYKSEEEVLKILSSWVKFHYAKTNGKLPVWGIILKYKISILGKVFYLDPQGNQIFNQEEVKGKATIRIH